MKKIIPYKKDIVFSTNISEVTSISLEHQLSIDIHNVVGNFIVSGDYKMSDNSSTVTSFDYQIPFEFKLDDIYEIDNAVVDIDDFYYEIVDDKILSISIDVFVDGLTEKLIYDEIPNIEEKKDIIEELYDEQNNCLDSNNEYEERCIEKEDKLPIKKEIDAMEEKEDNLKNKNSKLDDDTKEEIIDEKFNSIFGNLGDSNHYVSYIVYIIREGDTIESIRDKYEIDEEELKKYNNLSDLKLGDKIIIPTK